MINKGIFLVKIKKKYNSFTYYKNKVSIRSFLVEIQPKSKPQRSKRSLIKMRIAGKIGSKVIDTCLYNTYFLVQGSVILVSAPKLKSRKILELNVSKIYPFPVNIR